MIIKQLSVPQSTDQSFQMRRDYYPKHQSIWHYHEEVELVYVQKGSGTIFIGDRIKNFQPGNVILIPPFIPHYWFFDESESNSSEEPIDCLVIHFKKDFGIYRFLQAPEMNAIKLLLDKNRGLFMQDDSSRTVQGQLESCLQSEGLKKFIILLETLTALPDLESEELTSENYNILNHSEDQNRMNNLMLYIRENYKQKILLNDLAQVAGMVENSFCRYFKQKTGKTPLQFVNEIRIAHACHELRNGKMTLKEICYDSGFNNFVSFHKVFKTITGTTPLQFKG